MKTPFFLILLFAILATGSSLEAGKLTKKQLRAFYGTYVGTVAGVYGVTSDGVTINPQPTSYETAIKVNGRQKITAFSGTNRPYTITFNKPKGNKRRLKIRGTYSGEFVNPGDGEIEQVGGIRRYFIRKIGNGRSARYTLRARDELREGTLSYNRVKGNLEKR